eukprot:TRINITY_DN181_c3_g1_i2.p1 TRINITY_DN181_c3_g1~~TRINITY_DN181_c3_g1_i2.p1  ORF type:complete len:255 (+),score=143.95 TRINITY_DN181_c3_g1_i2:77-841(+)
MATSPKSVLVTGGAGYIGSHTVLELLNDGWDVTVVDNLSNASAESLTRVAELAGRAARLEVVDLCDRAALRGVFAARPYAAVVHFAGLKAVGESNSMPLRYYSNNITGTLVLLELMREFGVDRLVFSSSATVYGLPETLPITEAHPLRATNPYGRTKLFIEEILRAVYNLGTGQGYSVLEMVAAFEKASGRKVPHRIVGRREGDIGSCYGDVALARTELGWTAQRGLKEMVEDMWRWQEQNPVGYAKEGEVAKE